MKKDKLRKNWIEEFERFKNLVLSKLGEDASRNLQKIIPKLATYHYNKKRFMLLGDERKLYNFLIENSYNPYRVYRWFLFEKLPEELRYQLRNRMVSQKLASKINFKRKHESRSKVCVNIKLTGLNLVRSM